MASAISSAAICIDWNTLTTEEGVVDPTAAQRLYNLVVRIYLADLKPYTLFLGKESEIEPLSELQKVCKFRKEYPPSYHQKLINADITPLLQECPSDWNERLVIIQSTSDEEASSSIEPPLVQVNGLFNLGHVEQACAALKIDFELPICLPSMIGDNPVFIFLDIDGVLFKPHPKGERRRRIDQDAREIARKWEATKTNFYHKRIARAKHLIEEAVGNLYTLIDRVESAGKQPLIVLSTAWRHDASLRQLRETVFADHRFSQLMCGKTAPEIKDKKWSPECIAGIEYKERLYSRGDSVWNWLELYGGEDPNFAILDDCPLDLPRFGDRFVRTIYRRADGKTRFQLMEEHVDAACEVLGISQDKEVPEAGATATLLGV